MNNDSTAISGSEILIVDDMPDNLDLLCQTLESAGYQILVASSGEAALKIAAQTEPDLILLDVMMPGLNGFETCHRLKADERLSEIPVIFITAKDETASVVEGFQVGGIDYINKPFKEAEVLARVETHLQIAQLRKELVEKNDKLTASNEKLRQEIATRVQAERARDQAEDARQTASDQLSLISEREAERWGISGFIGGSQTIREILDDVRRLQATGSTSVLIQGESGTGKELIARAIHFGGPREKGAFIPVNCAAIPSELAESLLFGHTKGAFTGAERSRKGYFQLANGGTLFLDEIGEMPLDLQAKLLRVLEDGSFVPLGDTREKRVDVRVLAATNVNLQAKIEVGVFREDLYFRLAAFTVTVPPLRERPDDIPVLTNHFLEMFATEMVIETPLLSNEALEALKAYHFPGNVRELKNIIERALIESEGDEIRPEHLHFIGLRQSPSTSPSATDSVEVDYALTAQSESLAKRLDAYERTLILNAFEQTEDQKAAAALLGVPEPTLRYKMDKHGIRRIRAQPKRKNLR